MHEENVFNVYRGHELKRHDECVSAEELQEVETRPRLHERLFWNECVHQQTQFNGKNNVFLSWSQSWLFVLILIDWVPLTKQSYVESQF